MFFSDGFSTVISGKILEFRITRREPAVRMIIREVVTESAESEGALRSFNLSCPRPRSTHDEFDFSKKYN